MRTIEQYVEAVEKHIQERKAEEALYVAPERANLRAKLLEKGKKEEQDAPETFREKNPGSSGVGGDAAIIPEVGGAEQPILVDDSKLEQKAEYIALCREEDALKMSTISEQQLH